MRVMKITNSAAKRLDVNSHGCNPWNGVYNDLFGPDRAGQFVIRFPWVGTHGYSHSAPMGPELRRPCLRIK
jgi:hypothetical protein